MPRIYHCNPLLCWRVGRCNMHRICAFVSDILFALYRILTRFQAVFSFLWILNMMAVIERMKQRHLGDEM